ncbi:MAG: phosphate ABC transporter substrate-binding protein [Planctomycetales bacterium]|nr:phosphate ABC transporter substrate-binding protein [Planctomycetales bacterium]
MNARFFKLPVILVALLSCGFVVGCGKGDQGINVEGSDTMVNVAQAWAEEYRKERPEVDVRVSGGGSGQGIANLINGVVSMANASRKMKPEEMELAEKSTGKKAVEFVVGQDALAVYVHKDNPLDSISLEELAEIYGEGGTITKWSQLDVENVGCDNGEIVRVSRQSNSGTRHYFSHAVLGDDRQLKLGSNDQSGSKDVVDLISRTPCAIGYSGMGYATEGVKMLKIATKKGDEPVEPSVENTISGAYPIARPLLIYTMGEPTGQVKHYIDWILSEAGQKIVADKGYVAIQ